MIDALIDRIKALGSPIAVGLDTSFDYLPDALKKPCKSLLDAAKAITDFNFAVIDAVKDVVPAVKVQAAYYEMYGVAGLRAFADTLAEAKKRGLIVIADVKRNDIGSTAACYSAAYLGSVTVNGKSFTPFESDFITVNPYLGADGIRPFLDDCKKSDKGIFVLVKTSNPSSGQLQNRVLDDGKTLYRTVGALVGEWGADSVGRHGYSDVGAVVGATHKAEAQTLRAQMPRTFFLIPGYGAQGGSADDLAVCFNKDGLGGVVNSSRGIICAYKTDKFKDADFARAARLAALDMRSDITSALKRAAQDR
ncbi:MAG: orotidine-5'-phosphate decarboxylase [Clostridiales bacterium]|jgi:orotidine-5'-phosphate decarboxylase|nr:orotidine-5'-phosphate decarboxylase [Clostridiales bacterium]